MIKHAPFAHLFLWSTAEEALAPKTAIVEDENFGGWLAVAAGRAG